MAVTLKLLSFFSLLFQVYFLKLLYFVVERFFFLFQKYLFTLQIAHCFIELYLIALK